MPLYEYKVVPAPRKAAKIKGARTAEDRFAIAMQTVLNTYGADGWDYMRAESLPAEEREGLMSKTTVFQNMLVFRRVVTEEVITPETPTPVLIANHAATQSPPNAAKDGADELVATADASDVAPRV